MKIFATLILMSFFVFAQGKDLAPLDLISFLVGRLDDYMGC